MTSPHQHAQLHNENNNSSSGAALGPTEERRTPANNVRGGAAAVTTPLLDSYFLHLFTQFNTQHMTLPTVLQSPSPVPSAQRAPPTSTAALLGAALQELNREQCELQALAASAAAASGVPPPLASLPPSCQPLSSVLSPAVKRSLYSLWSEDRKLSEQIEHCLALEAKAAELHSLVGPLDPVPAVVPAHGIPVSPTLAGLSSSLISSGVPFSLNYTGKVLPIRGATSNESSKAATAPVDDPTVEEITSHHQYRYTVRCRIGCYCQRYGIASHAFVAIDSSTSNGNTTQQEKGLVDSGSFLHAVRAQFMPTPSPPPLSSTGGLIETDKEYIDCTVSFDIPIQKLSSGAEKNSTAKLGSMHSHSNEEEQGEGEAEGEGSLRRVVKLYFRHIEDLDRFTVPERSSPLLRRLLLESIHQRSTPANNQDHPEGRDGDAECGLERGAVSVFPPMTQLEILSHVLAHTQRASQAAVVAQQKLNTSDAVLPNRQQPTAVNGTGIGNSAPGGFDGVFFFPDPAWAKALFGFKFPSRRSTATGATHTSSSSGTALDDNDGAMPRFVTAHEVLSAVESQLEPVPCRCVTFPPIALPVHPHPTEEGKVEQAPTTTSTAATAAGAGATKKFASTSPVHASYRGPDPKGMVEINPNPNACGDGTDYCSSADAPSAALHCRHLDSIRQALEEDDQALAQLLEGAVTLSARLQAEKQCAMVAAASVTPEGGSPLSCGGLDATHSMTSLLQGWVQQTSAVSSFDPAADPLHHRPSIATDRPSVFKI